MSSVGPPDGGYTYYQKSIDELEQELEADAKRREVKRQEALETQSKRHEEALRRKDESHARDIERVKEGANEDLSRVKEDSRRENEYVRSRNYDRMGRMQAETDAQRKEALHEVERLKAEYENAARKNESSARSSSDVIQREQLQREENTARAMRESHQHEVNTLRGSLQELADQDRLHSKGYAQGRAAAIGELEDNWRLVDYVRNEAAEKEIEATKARAKDAERYYTIANDKNLKDQGLMMARLLNERTSEAHSEQQMLTDQFQRDHDQMSIRMKRDRELSQQSNERMMSQAATDREKALAQQADSFNRAYGDMADANAEKIKHLESNLQEARTSDDVSKISPAAEERVRNLTSQEYEKVMKADDDRRDAEISSLRRNFQDSYNTLLDDKRTIETRLNQDRALEQHTEQTTYLDSVAELADDRDRSLRHKEADNQRAFDSLTRDHARLLERQRREYEDIIYNLKNDANTRLASTRQENEFNSKMAQKAFSVRQNELIREYEKKLADQRAEYETQVGELKSQMAVALREAERRSKTSIEEVSKGYEQRMTQMEFQQKERERLISQNYSDELDKVKRSNALLIQKKS
jgi:hypothetical protein